MLVLLIGAAGFVLRYFVLMSELKQQADDDFRTTFRMLDMTYVAKLYEETREIYDGIPEEERKDPFAPEYYERFFSLVADQEDFWNARDVLVALRETESTVNNLAFFFYDETYDRYVYVIDGDEDDQAFLPGQWLSGENGGNTEKLSSIGRVISSDWYMTSNHTEFSGWSFTDFVEVKSDDGRLLGYAYAEVPADYVFRNIIEFLIFFILAILVIIAVRTRLDLQFLAKRIIRPLNTLAETARDYTSRDKSVEEESEELFAPLDLSTGDEVETLWRTLADMEMDMKNTLQHIRVLTEEKTRWATELSLATDIQMEALPEPLVDRPEFLLSASMTPAKEVGGDFYDFFMIDEDHLGMVIADVSGKGVPAALFMMTSKTHIRNYAMMGLSPEETMVKANDRICEGSTGGLFVTVWFAVLDLNTGHVETVNAGHEYPFIKKAGKSFEVFTDKHGVAAGAFEGMVYRSCCFDLEPGDMLFVYTDGAPEAQSSENEFFGMERLTDALNSAQDDVPEHVIETVRDTIGAFVGDREPFDDLTMLCLRFQGRNSDS